MLKPERKTRGLAAVRAGFLVKRLINVSMIDNEHPLKYLLIFNILVSLKKWPALRSLGVGGSGCWELNPVYTNPNRAYYRYTTPRLLIFWINYFYQNKIKN